MFDTRILIFAYADVLKLKGANTVSRNKITLDRINLEKIEKLSPTTRKMNILQF